MAWCKKWVNGSEFPDGVEVTLGRDGNVRRYTPERTCKEVLIDKHWRGCSECAYKWEFMYGIATCKRPNYCPNCGARVEKGGNDD